MCNLQVQVSGNQEGPASDDEFDVEAMDEEQESVMKVIKFPEIETVNKIPAAAPKVSKCLTKRLKGVTDLLDKFNGASKLDHSQTATLNDKLQQLFHVNLNFPKQTSIYILGSWGSLFEQWYLVVSAEKL